MIEFEVYGLGAIGNVPSWFYWIMGLLLLVGTGVIYVKGSLCSKFNENYSKKNSKHNYWLRSVAALTLGAYVVLVFCTTIIFRETRAESTINLIPFSSYFCIAEDSYLKEVSVINMLNIVMLLPVGFLMKCSFSSMGWKQVLLLSIILSSSVELMQFLFRKGLCEIDDIIHNVIGCMIGYAIAKLIVNVLSPLMGNKRP